MYLAALNKMKQLLYVSYIGEVRLEELQHAQQELKALLADLPAEFRLLVDLSQLESMEPECAAEIGRLMELIDKHGVGAVVRVIPDPSKDIGMNILTQFHYRNRPKVVTCKTMVEAAKHLSI